MAEAAAILKGRKKGAEIGDLVLDVTISEAHSHRASATDLPVEDGSNTSDHVIQLPDSLSLEGVWTDTPSGENEAQLHRARDLYFELVEVKEAGEPIEVVTGLRVYPSVVITSIDTRRDARTGFTVPVAIGVKEIRTVDRRTEIIAPEETAHGNAPRSKRGRQKPEPVDGGASEKESSVLYDIFYGD